jgi:NADPH:quinone reductase-like Zn-dependent oxidoreductase
MRTLTHTAYGDSDVLRIEQRPAPQPTAGEVVVRMRAAGVGPDAWHLMTGKPYAARAVFGLRRPKPMVLGADVAGVVEAVGPGVTRFRVGDEVYGSSKGSFAELVIAREELLLPKPAALSFEHAAAVATSGMTALQALRTGGVAVGRSVLVLGAGGGIGGFAVQLAKHLGATVTGVVSTGKLELARSLGCDAVIDYTREPIPGRYDVVVDTGGSRPVRVIRSMLNDGGTGVLAGGEGGGPLLGSAARQLFAFGTPTIKGLFAKVTPADLAELDARLRDGSVRVPLDRTFPLAQAGAAIDYLMSGKARGKIVLVP